jgi:hypothetical protein
VLNNQCLGNEVNAAKNAEPPGRGTEEFSLMDSDEFIAGIRTLSGEQRFSESPAAASTPDETISADDGRILKPAFG